MADIRRRADWLVVKVIIWSAYMLADTTAIYALGHLSVVVVSLPEHQLMALWAPLLLVHLGGQDNITAYAIEDNRLWLRHLLTFGVQVVAAAYVLYASSILSRPSLLRSASILMFLVGVLKYGERVWALMGADRLASSSLSARNYKDSAAARKTDKVDVKGSDEEAPARQTDKVDVEGLDEEAPARQTDKVDVEGLDEEAPQTDKVDVEGLDEEARRLVISYSLLDVPKQMFEGPTRYVKIKTARNYKGDSTARNYEGDSTAWNYEDDSMLPVVEMQLTMMYDLLYTKSAVVHTRYGFFVHVISLPFTIAALLLFHALVDQDGYTKVDVLVTKVLLTGAVVLEIISVLKAMFSIWTAALLYERKWYKLGLVAQLVEPKSVIRPMMVLVQRKGYWSGHMRQHELFKVFQHTNHSIGSIIAKKTGREDLWNSTFYSWSTRVPEDFFKKVLKVVSRTAQDGVMHIRKSRGHNALGRHSLSLGKDLAWSVEFDDLDESILVWHIATHVYLLWYSDNVPDRNKILDLRKATKAVCNYMLYLLAARPYMLPYPVTRQRYVQLCHDSITHLSCDAYELLCDILAQKEDLMQGFPLKPDRVKKNIGVSPSGGTSHPSVNSTGGGQSINTTLDYGCHLAAKLIHTADAAERSKNAKRILKLIFEVWVEMLCYTAYWCNEKSHAKNLASGGELMTIVAFMMVYSSSKDFINTDDKRAAGSSSA